MSAGFRLRCITLSDESHKDKDKDKDKDGDGDKDASIALSSLSLSGGITTPDGFQWGHKITHWFGAAIRKDLDLPAGMGMDARQVMSWSRLAGVLKQLGA